MLVDEALALERMGGMPDLLQRISQAYARALPAELALWRQCWAEGNEAQALRVLHTLKGTAASLGALPLAEALRQLEAACRSAAPNVPVLAAELEVVAQQTVAYWLREPKD